MLGLILYKIGAFLTRILPENVSRRITFSLAMAQFLVRFKSKKNVRSNLELILNGKVDGPGLSKMTKRVFFNFAESIRLFLKLPWIPPEQILAATDYSGCEDVLDELKSNRGSIIVACHIGPWELGGAFLAAMGIKVNTVALDHPSRKVTEFFNLRRMRSNLTVYPIKDSFKQMKRALRRGECVVLLIDRAYRKSEKRYCFFGSLVDLPSSHLILGASLNAPLFPGAFLFDEKRGFKVLFKGPYTVTSENDRESQMKKIQEKCLRDLEDIIKEHPDQFFHFFNLKNS